MTPTTNGLEQRIDIGIDNTAWHVVMRSIYAFAIPYLLFKFPKNYPWRWDGLDVEI